MKKNHNILLVTVLTVLLLCLPADSFAQSALQYDVFKKLCDGTAGALDKLDGALINDGSVAIVITPTDDYHCYMDEDSAASELCSGDNPIVAPDVNANDKRWLCRRLGTTTNGDVSGPGSSTVGNVATFADTTGKTIGDSTTALSTITDHLSNTSDPHSVTGAQTSFSDPDNNYAATDVTSAIAEMDNTNASGPNATDYKINWEQIGNMPAAFADGTDDGGSTTGEAGAVAANWSGDTDAPQKAALYTYFSLFDPDFNGFTDETWLTELVPDRLRLTVLSSAPGSPVAGAIYYANSTWNPASLDITTNYYVIYDGSQYIALFDEDGNWYVNTVQGAMKVFANPGNPLDEDEMNSVIVKTSSGDVQIPANMCDTATGRWLTVKTVGSFLNSIDSADGSDQFVLSDGTVLTAGNELDLGGSTGNQATVSCLQANKWYVTGEIGECVDGGGS